MTVPIYDAGVTGMAGFSGFPSIEVERKAIDDPINIFPEYNAHVGDFGVADITVIPDYNSTTRVLSVSASAHFAVDVSQGNGAYNLAYVVTENRVNNSSLSYAQQNDYSGGSFGPLQDAEYNFAALPNPVPASQMYYDNVARTIEDTYTGTAGSLPGTIAAGSIQNYSFVTTYTLPNSQNPANMKVIVLLINTITGEIMNANDASLTLTNIAEVNNSLETFGVYPNPFTEITNISFTLKKDENVTINVYNMLGEKVYSNDYGTMSQGEHIIQINGNNLSSGLYLVRLSAGDYTISKKVSLNK